MKTPRDIIAEQEVAEPGAVFVGGQTAMEILDALSAAGYVICRMSGGKHQGKCPTCGCEPVD